MKYFKFKQVCSQTGISVGIKPPCVAGPWWPNLPGLEVILIGNLHSWCYGTASDEAEPNDDNLILEITEQKIIEVLDAHYATEKNRKLEEIAADYTNTIAKLTNEGEVDFLTLLDEVKAAVSAVVSNFASTPVETSHVRWQENEELVEATENQQAESVLKHNPHLYRRYQIAKNT